MNTIGVMVGSALFDLESKEIETDLETPWGAASAPVQELEMGATRLYLLRRHGAQQQLSPHQVNYRANVWLLKQMGVDAIIGTHTVGSIDLQLDVGQLVVPHQIIDYTWGRPQTYDDERRHVEFSYPYDEALRQRIIASFARSENIESPQGSLAERGVYGCTQGPRLETAAEIERMRRDGCDVVGMTGMPEAGLARELDIAYASVCVIVNPAAGLSDAQIDMEALLTASRNGAHLIQALLAAFTSL
jgi:5'-methylthioinosine phosphorylase